MVKSSLLDDDSLASWVSDLYPDPDTTELSSTLPPLAELLRGAEHASLRFRVRHHLDKRATPTVETLQGMWNLRQSGKGTSTRLPVSVDGSEEDGIEAAHQEDVHVSRLASLRDSNECCA